MQFLFKSHNYHLFFLILYAKEQLSFKNQPFNKSMIFKVWDLIISDSFIDSKNGLKERIPGIKEFG